MQGVRQYLGSTLDCKNVAERSNWDTVLLKLMLSGGILESMVRIPKCFQESNNNASIGVASVAMTQAPNSNL